MAVVIPRAPWPAGFPDVVVHGDLRARNSHPSYPAAKSGDPQAARALVEDLLAGAAIRQLAAMVADSRPLLLAVTAEEVAGFNAIPDAMAQSLAARLGLSAVAGTVVQANKVVDDHVGFGGTLANLRGFVEQRGGSVLGMTTLTETREARRIAVRKETLDVLRSRHGWDLEQFWRAEFGHGFECLTNIEAGYLCRAESPAAIQARMAEAAELARCGGLSSIGIGLRSAG